MKQEADASLFARTHQGHLFVLGLTGFITFLFQGTHLDHVLLRSKLVCPITFVKFLQLEIASDRVIFKLPN